MLLVGNHSGGTMIADTFVFAQSFLDHFGPDREFRQLAHDLVFKTPGLRTLAQRYGTVPASPENMERALDDGAALLVYPGGDEDSFRPSWETGEVALGGPDGVRGARPGARGARLSPSCRSAGRRPRSSWAAAGGLPAGSSSIASPGSKVLPIVLGPPYGITVLDFPGRIPLPSKITIRVMPPIDLREELGRGPGHRRGLRLISSRMQRTLTRLNGQRRIPVIG